MSQFTETHPPMLFMALAAASIALLVSYSVDAEPLSADTMPAPMQLAAATLPTTAFEMPTLAPSAIVISADPGFRLEDGALKLFFAPSKTDIPPSATHALKNIVDAIEQGQRVQISGFHDETGNPKQNIWLSKKRAEVVQKQLIALGAPANAIEIKKPVLAAATKDHAQARRVEITMLR